MPIVGKKDKKRHETVENSLTRLTYCKEGSPYHSVDHHEWRASKHKGENYRQPSIAMAANNFALITIYYRNMRPYVALSTRFLSSISKDSHAVTEGMSLGPRC